MRKIQSTNSGLSKGAGFYYMILAGYPDMFYFCHYPDLLQLNFLYVSHQSVAVYCYISLHNGQDALSQPCADPHIVLFQEKSIPLPLVWIFSGTLHIETSFQWWFLYNGQLSLSQGVHKSLIGWIYQADVFNKDRS